MKREDPVRLGGYDEIPPKHRKRPELDYFDMDYVPGSKPKSWVHVLILTAIAAWVVFAVVYFLVPMMDSCLGLP